MCSKYRKYVPAAYAKKLKRPKTPAQIFEPRDQWLTTLDHADNWQIKAIKYKPVASPVLISSWNDKRNNTVE